MSVFSVVKINNDFTHFYSVLLPNIIKISSQLQKIILCMVALLTQSQLPGNSDFEGKKNTSKSLKEN